MPISSRLIVNPAALKLKRDRVQPLLAALAAAVAARRSGMSGDALDGPPARQRGARLRRASSRR